MLENYQTEITAYNDALPALQKEHDGAFVVIQGSRVEDQTFPSYEDALSWGYERFGLSHFFVKQVADPRHTVHFMRSVA